jgi:arabinose-5-phosphate isomerase
MTPNQFIADQAAALSTLEAHYATADGQEAINKALLWILCQPGKAVVTGMGKSGLIGRKIAATLQSTGQPSAFLDPAAAAHGDMGMIQDGDFLLVLSNSGQTNEIMPVLEYADGRNRIIAITARPQSPLALAADVVLTYPERPEGCPIGRAPMASTLMQLVIGDCLAAMLMVERKFTETDFLALHHGGYLGADIRGSLCLK